MIASDGRSAFTKSLKLICQAFRRGNIVVIPMCDDVSVSRSATEVSLLSNFKGSIEVNESNPFIRWNQIPNVVAVRQNQKFPVLIRLVLVTPNRLREPLPAISRQTQTSHERVPARSPLELAERLRASRSAA